MSLSYSAYGLSLASDWELALPKSGRSDLHGVDVTLVDSVGPLQEAAAVLGDEPTSDADDWNRQASLPNGAIYLRWGRLFRFLVEPDGRTIFGEALTDFQDEPFQFYLLAHALSYALLRQGLEPLHVTAVVDPEGNAIGLTADPGAGKSTLAAGCLRAGYRLLSDDLLVVRDAGGWFRVDPGPARIKLFPEVARAVLGVDAGAAVPMNDITTKLVIPVDQERSWPGEARLVALYVLQTSSERTARVGIRRLAGRKAFLEVTHATFNDGIRDPARLERQFRFATGLVERLPVLSLAYPRNLASLDEVVHEVWRDAGTRYATAEV